MHAHIRESAHVMLTARCNKRAQAFETYSTIDDVAWDLKAYTGWSSSLPGIVVAFRGTDSHSIGNWVENMRYWRTDFKVPYPGANGSKVHTGTERMPCFSTLIKRAACQGFAVKSILLNVRWVANSALWPSCTTTPVRDVAKGSMCKSALISNALLLRHNRHSWLLGLLF